MESADVVIVGAGMAALSAGALLSRSGARVAVFEKHSKLGGYAQYFGQDPTFDASTHIIGGCGPKGWTTQALIEAGALDRVELLPLDPVYVARYPGAELRAPADPERWRQELCAAWPAEAAGITSFVRELEEIGAATLSLVDGPPSEGPLARRAGSTLAEMLDDHVRDPEARAALSSLWLFGGLPPGRLSALHYAMLWYTLHVQGSAAVRGGVRMLSGALGEAIQESGGTVETGARVERIARDRGRVTGVVLEDGREWSARAVISTASPYDTFETLLAAEGQSPAGYPALRGGYVASVSAMQVHLLVDGPLEAPARTAILHDTVDQDQAFLDLQRAEPLHPALVCTVLDRGDPERAPEGKHLVSLFTLAPYTRGDNWNVPFAMRRTREYRMLPEYLELRDRLGQGMIRAAETLFPGLGERTTARKVGSPITLERYTFNMGGAAFGWANLPEQCGPGRPGPRTPFRGLYMAGHWTFPGGSIAAALTSGRIAARTLLSES